MAEEKALTPQQTFEENIKSRIRKDVGELIPDEVLSEMMKTSLQEMFFTRRRVNDGSEYSPRWKEVPSWFDDEVQTLLRGKVEVMLKEYMAENKDNLATAMVDVVKDHAPHIMANFFAAILTNNAENIAYRAASDIENRLRNSLNQY